MPQTSRLAAWACSALAATMCVVSAAGCSHHREAASAGRAPAAERTEPQAKTHARVSPYGPDGNLRASDQVVAGLRLPLGLEHLYDQDRRHSYRTSVPIGKVIAYFGPRLMTGEVQRVGPGAIFRHAIPKGVRGGAVKLDVSILAASSGTRVEISEIRPPPEHPPSIEEIQRELRAKQRPNE